MDSFECARAPKIFPKPDLPEQDSDTAMSGIKDDVAITHSSKEKKAPSVIPIETCGDVTFYVECKDGNGSKTEFLVCSRTLARASRIFDIMIYETIIPRGTGKTSSAEPQCFSFGTEKVSP